MKNIIAVAVLVVATPGGLHWPPYQDYGPGQERCADLLTDESRTIQGLLVDASTVDAAQGVFGPASLREEGDASEHTEWRCWRAANGDGTVVYVDRGEVGGGLRVLGREMAFPERSKCAKSSNVHRGIATKSGLHLGLTRAQVEDLVGPSTKSAKDWYERSCCGKKLQSKGNGGAGAGDESAAACSLFRGVETRGKLVGFAITWTEAD
jgi:hypothetical protein